MKVRMKVQIGGSRNDKAWPAVGEEMTVPDAEGADLCAQGFAEPVAAVKASEKRPAAKKAEKR